MTMMRVDGRFHDRAQPLLALAERFFDLDAPAQVVQDAGKGGLSVELHPPHREVQREGAAVFPASADLAARSDDARDAGFEIVREIAIVLLPIGLGISSLTFWSSTSSRDSRTAARRPG